MGKRDQIKNRIGESLRKARIALQSWIHDKKIKMYEPFTGYRPYTEYKSLMFLFVLLL